MTLYCKQKFPKNRFLYFQRTEVSDGVSLGGDVPDARLRILDSLTVMPPAQLEELATAADGIRKRVDETTYGPMSRQADHNEMIFDGKSQVYDILVEGSHENPNESVRLSLKRINPTTLEYQWMYGNKLGKQGEINFSDKKSWYFTPSPTGEEFPKKVNIKFIDGNFYCWLEELPKTARQILDISLKNGLLSEGYKIMQFKNDRLTYSLSNYYGNSITFALDSANQQGVRNRLMWTTNPSRLNVPPDQLRMKNVHEFAQGETKIFEGAGFKIMVTYLDGHFFVNDKVK